jgi:hypothetical protein
MGDVELGAKILLQDLLGILQVLPFWIVLMILFSPTLVAVCARNLIAVSSTFILNLTCLILIAIGTSTTLPLAIVSFSAALIFALFGIRERVVWQKLTRLEVRIGHIDDQTIAFLRALERRSDTLDQWTSEAREAFEAQKATGDIAKAQTIPPKIPARGEITLVQSSASVSQAPDGTPRTPASFNPSHPRQNGGVGFSPFLSVDIKASS